jgi:4-hydroxy-tetrahydrodipicolinate reductase
MASVRMLKVALVGLGPIGVEIGKALTAQKDVTVAAAADPNFAGKPIGELVPGAAGLVDGDLRAALGRGVDVAVLATTSRFAGIVADLEAAIAARVHVVSTCEELAAPGDDAATWERLHQAARDAGVTLLGTGVNPGFVMDRLVLQLAGACVHVERVKVTRVVDASRRRGPLRKKVGEGLTEAQFQEGARAGRIGHVGLRQSAALIARGLGWKLDGYDETIEPVLEGELCVGLHQVGRGRVGARELIMLDLTMAVNATDAHDRILLEADPMLDVRVEGGTHGDRGTVGTVVNAVLRAPRAPRGLVTVADVFA